MSEESAMVARTACCIIAIAVLVGLVAADLLHGLGIMFSRRT